MRTWKQRGGALAFGALLVGLLAGAAPAAAEPAASVRAQGAPGTVAVVAAVRIRDLMSAADRQLYRQQISQARDLAARQRVQSEWLARLQARAAEHGVIMVIETRPLPPEGRRVATAAAAAPGAAAPAVAPATVAIPGAVVVRPVEPPAPPPPRAP
jgi:hypothetical protein